MTWCTRRFRPCSRYIHCICHHSLLVQSSVSFKLTTDDLMVWTWIPWIPIKARYHGIHPQRLKSPPMLVKKNYPWVCYRRKLLLSSSSSDAFSRCKCSRAPPSSSSTLGQNLLVRSASGCSAHYHRSFTTRNYELQLERWHDERLVIIPQRFLWGPPELKKRH